MKSAISELENQIKLLKRNQMTAAAAAAAAVVENNQEIKIKEDPGTVDGNTQEEIEKLRQDLASAHANLEREETALIDCQKYY